MADYIGYLPSYRISPTIYTRTFDTDTKIVWRGVFHDYCISFFVVDNPLKPSSTLHHANIIITLVRVCFERVLSQSICDRIVG